MSGFSDKFWNMRPTADGGDTRGTLSPHPKMSPKLCFLAEIMFWGQIAGVFSQVKKTNDGTDWYPGSILVSAGILVFWPK